MGQKDLLKLASCTRSIMGCDFLSNFEDTNQGSDLTWFPVTKGVCSVGYQHVHQEFPSSSPRTYGSPWWHEGPSSWSLCAGEKADRPSLDDGVLISTPNGGSTLSACPPSWRAGLLERHPVGQTGSYQLWYLITWCMQHAPVQNTSRVQWSTCPLLNYHVPGQLVTMYIIQK